MVYSQYYNLFAILYQTHFDLNKNLIKMIKPCTIYFAIIISWDRIFKTEKIFLRISCKVRERMRNQIGHTKESRCETFSALYLFCKVANWDLFHLSYVRISSNCNVMQNRGKSWGFFYFISKGNAWWINWKRCYWGL